MIIHLFQYSENASHAGISILQSKQINKKSRNRVYLRILQIFPQILCIFNSGHLLPIAWHCRGGLEGINQSLPEMLESCSVGQHVPLFKETSCVSCSHFQWLLHMKARLSDPKTRKVYSFSPCDIYNIY